MKTELKLLPKSEAQVTVEVSQELLDKYEAEAARAISEHMDIPGFRRGQAPKAFVISAVGADSFFQEVLNVALPRSYFEAVKEHNLKVISRPEIKILVKSPLKFEARVAVHPEIKIKGYEKIKIAEKPVEITEKEIDDVVNEMRKYKANYKPVEREIRKGDRIEIDFEGFDEEGKSLPNTKSDNHPLFVGEGTLVKGFEEQLVGMKKGEKKKFPVTFPKDFHAEKLRGKTVHFEVTLKRTEETVLPELTEEFIHDVLGQKKALPDFREDIKKDMASRKKADARGARENELLEKLLKEAKFDLSDILVNEEIDFMIEDLKRELERRGASYENYVKKLKEEKRDLRKEYTAEAEKRVRVRLIIDHLFKEMGITVTDDEFNAAATRLLSQTQETERAQVKEQLDQKKELYLRLKNNLMLEKLFAKFLD